MPLWNYILFHIILFLIPVMMSLKLHKVSMPPLRVTGQSAKLSCLYDMGGDVLYSIKWYKGGKEFYRYVQQDRPPIQVFPMDGISVDKSQSDQHTVILTNLTLASSGRYKCEVSADAPSFQTSFNQAEMIVIALPESGPVISSSNWTVENLPNESNRIYWPSSKGKIYDEQMGQYGFAEAELDGIIIVNCTSKWSKPAAALEWYVNGEKVQGEHLIEYAPLLSDGSDSGDYADLGHRTELLETSVLGLSWNISVDMLKQRRDGQEGIVLNCTAAVGSVYWRSTSLVVLLDPVVAETEMENGNTPWESTASSMMLNKSLIKNDTLPSKVQIQQEGQQHHLVITSHLHNPVWVASRSINHYSSFSQLLFLVSLLSSLLFSFPCFKF